MDLDNKMILLKHSIGFMEFSQRKQGPGLLLLGQGATEAKVVEYSIFGLIFLLQTDKQLTLVSVTSQVQLLKGQEP